MNWIVIAAAAGAVVSVIAITAAIGKALKVIATLLALHPVMVAIAKEFKTNAGSSLKDQMNRLESMAQDALTVARVSREVADVARQTQVHQTAIIETMRVEIIRQGLMKELQVPT